MRLCKSFPAAITLVTSLALSGCSLTIGTDPNAYPFPSAEIVGLTPGVGVMVENAYTTTEKVVVGNRVYCDLQHFTATSVTMVQRELSKQGLVVSQAGERTLRLKMKYPSWILGSWSMTARITLEAELGNGDKVVIDGENQTGGNAMRAFNGAILRAVTGLLKDPKLVAYLQEPSSQR